MKKSTETSIVKSISLIDEIYKNKGRQNIIGTIITGIGLTITGVGIVILTDKSRNEIPNDKEDPSNKQTDFAEVRS